MVLKEILQIQVLSIVQFIIVVAIGIVITKLVTDMLKAFFRQQNIKKAIEELGYEETNIDLILMAVRYSLYIITAIIALSQFGFTSIIFNIIIIVIVIFILLLMIYSVKDIVPNVAAGLYISSMKPIAVGEKVTIGVYHGKVKEISLMTTTIKDETGRIIIVPNSNILRKDIIKTKSLKRGKKKIKRR